jgi:hypothetical protein
LKKEEFIYYGVQCLRHCNIMVATRDSLHSILCEYVSLLHKREAISLSFGKLIEFILSLPKDNDNGIKYFLGVYLFFLVVVCIGEVVEEFLIRFNQLPCESCVHLFECNCTAECSDDPAESEVEG